MSGPRLKEASALRRVSAVHNRLCFANLLPQAYNMLPEGVSAFVNGGVTRRYGVEAVGSFQGDNPYYGGQCRWAEVRGGLVSRRYRGMPSGRRLTARAFCA